MLITHVDGERGSLSADFDGQAAFLNPAGHIATYVGRGLVVTNMPSGRVKIVSWSSVDRWGPYLGWAPPYYK